MVDSTVGGMDIDALVRLHQAFAGNSNFNDIMGQHGLGFYLLLYRLLGDTDADGWTVMSSPHETGNVFVATCDLTSIRAGDKPDFYMVPSNLKESLYRDDYLKAMARHLGRPYKTEREMRKSKFRDLLFETHGTVIQVRTSRKFGGVGQSLADYYAAEVVPALSRQIHLSGGGAVKVVVDGKRMALSNSYFVRRDEYMQATFTLKDEE